MLANGKIARQVSSRAYNPTYKFTSNTEAFSVGEVSAPIVAFGDMEAATVKRDLVEYFFGKLMISDTIMYAILCSCAYESGQRTSVSLPSWDGQRRKRW